MAGLSCESCAYTLTQNTTETKKPKSSKKRTVEITETVVVPPVVTETVVVPPVVTETVVVPPVVAETVVEPPVVAETVVEPPVVADEDEEDEEIITIEVMIEGKMYLKDDDSNLYDIQTHEFIRNLYEYW